jgi:hypothetical protein
VTLLEIYAGVTIAILLVTELDWPFDPVRRWLARTPRVQVNGDGTAWAIIWQDKLTPYPSRKAALGSLTYPQRVKGWLNDLTTCPWCLGGWVSLAACTGFVEGPAWDRLQVWPLVWLAAAATCVVLDRVADH